MKKIPIIKESQKLKQIQQDNKVEMNSDLIAIKSHN